MIGASGRSWAWARLAAALAVMLVAVLPHATLAASSGFRMNHAATEPVAQSAAHGSGAGHSHHAQPHTMAATCHDPAPTQDKTSSPVMPACCILGCGLLGTLPDFRAAIAMPTWLIRVSAPTHRMTGRTTEPAERPPRLLPTLARAT